MKMSFSRWKVQETVVYPNNGILFDDKRNELARHRKICMNLKCALLKEKYQSEKATYCVSPTIWNSEKCKTVEWVNTPVFAKGCRRGKLWIDEINRYFRTIKLFCMILLAFGLSNTNSKPNVCKLKRNYLGSQEVPR